MWAWFAHQYSMETEVPRAVRWARRCPSLSRSFAYGSAAQILLQIVTLAQHHSNQRARRDRSAHSLLCNAFTDAQLRTMAVSYVHGVVASRAYGQVTPPCRLANHDPASFEAVAVLLSIRDQGWPVSCGNSVAVSHIARGLLQQTAVTLLAWDYRHCATWWMRCRRAGRGSETTPPAPPSSLPAGPGSISPACLPRMRQRAGPPRCRPGNGCGLPACSVGMVEASSLACRLVRCQRC